MTVTPSGNIITFHSYKGGGGASTVLANTAWLLATAGKRVLVVDWDLQAPSLHRFFRPFLTDPELTSTEGVIDAAIEFASPSAPGTPPDVASYAVSLDWSFPGSGGLDFLPAGQQGPAFSIRTTEFRWQSFLDGPAGVRFVTSAREGLRALYDFVFIDSSPGVGETTRLCSVVLPDTLCLCFTLSRVSVAGSQQLAESALRQRAGRPLRVFPITTRIDLAEKMLLDQGREMARQALGVCLNHLEPSSAERYWKESEFPYVPYQAYGEVLPIFRDQAGDLRSVCAASERLAAFLAPREVFKFSYPTPQQTDSVLARYKSTDF